jgi:hypothetical protein
MKGLFTGDQLLWLLFFLLIVDFFIVFLFLILYFRLKKFLNLPWDEILEGIEKARDLVFRLEKLKTGLEKRGETEGKRIKDTVLELHKKGLGVKEISRRLKLSEGEVELIIATQKLGR